MVVILQTTNLVRLSFLRSLLHDYGIYTEVFDANISALEAGIGAFPRRLMVKEWQEPTAKNILCDAGELYDD